MRSGSMQEKRSPARYVSFATLILFFFLALCPAAVPQVSVQGATSVAQLDHRFFIDGHTYSFTQQGVQQALNDACAGIRGTRGGTDIYLPTGRIRLSANSDQQFLITCPLRIHGPGAAAFWFVVEDSVPADVPVFRVRMSQTFTSATAEFDNFRITGTSARGVGGGDAFFLDGTNAGVQVRIHDVQVNFIAPTAWFLNMTAGHVNRFFTGHIWDNQIVGGINMNSSSTADAWLIEHNTFESVDGGNVNPCINATTEQGSAHIVAFHNLGGCTGGFFISHGTTQCKILYNQIEQPDITTEPNSAIIDLMGDQYAINGCEIRGNNINEHEFVNVGVRLGNAKGTTIEGNVFSLRPGSGTGILISSQAHDTVIPFNQYLGIGPGTATIHNRSNVSAYAARGPEGKAVAPTYSFLNHPRTGWYSADGVLEAAVDGNDALAISGNGIGVNGQVRADSAVLGTAKIAGNLTVHGTIFKSAGGFRIDDPLDPEHKWLSHSFVESPDMKDIYDGVAVLNKRGEAEVILPAYFQALNKDYRYQLTCIGGSAPVYIAQEIKNNRFRIAGGKAGLKVSWLVTGTRHDPYARSHRIPVEAPKTPTKGRAQSSSAVSTH